MNAKVIGRFEARQTSAHHATTRGASQVRLGFGGLTIGALSVFVSLATACAPVVRPAPFRGASNLVTGASLEGPFDGQVIDATTREPIPDATVLGVWTYEQGDGFVGPGGSHSVEIPTDPAGRYRIPSVSHGRKTGKYKLVSFHITAYKRGYEGYRSDAIVEGGKRHDFVSRHNEIELAKWSNERSHAEHLIYLGASGEVSQQLDWSIPEANLDLYSKQGGEVPSQGTPNLQPQPAIAATDMSAPELSVPIPALAQEPEATAQPAVDETVPLLEASGFLTQADVTHRTGTQSTFVTEELKDISRTARYHGIHLRASEQDESFDVTYRIWLKPKLGFDAIEATFKATLPGIEVSNELTEKTWLSDAGDIRVVAFIDSANKSAVLLTCGASQCGDIATAVVLAKHVQGQLGSLIVEDPSEAAPPAPQGQGN